ncbi:immune-associated nucleotide-binding protein 9-like [Solanum stenotomum]|uniref:immune-associated nucleotide-binding protein 9-like n=1 Tax=Solanum stenotomum TaxID=172797 RepID=UPI0020D11995|nr:immune-associated nucleotide-binding protein 9-like [Solanum stenotomum]
MGGSAVADDWEVTTHEKQTLVLLGRTGNGKCATGNSILGSKEFNSKCSSNGVTSTCELKSTRLDNGLMIDVIDTPGIYTTPFRSFSVHITDEPDVIDYMIVVFTGDDEFEDSDEALDEYLGKECPEPLNETIKLCDDRVVVFDNKTKDPKKKEDQLNKLLLLVTLVLDKNNGVPYTNELFKQLKALKGNSLIGDGVNQLNEPIAMSYEEHFKKLTEAVTSMLKEITHTYLEQWATDRADRIAEKQKAEAAHVKFEMICIQSSDTHDVWCVFNLLIAGKW